MTKRAPEDRAPLLPRRRELLRHGAALGIAGALGPQFAGSAFAQADDLAPYKAAKINWRQVEGESITVAVIPASYFENLISLQPQFEALTGIKLRFEKVPPGQIRQKALLDLSSKTATYATHAADPMYYPLYVANKWVEPLDRYLNDATLTDGAWFKFDDIIKAWRDADSIDGKRVTSIWNWGFPINAALSDRAKKATWLFVEWAASAETQARTSWKFAGPAKRSGINRVSQWRSPEFAAAMKDAGDNFIPAAIESLEQDTDVDWRPRVPQWPAIGEAMGTAVQSALVGQKKPKEALDEAQARIQQILKG